MANHPDAYRITTPTWSYTASTLYFAKRLAAGDPDGTVIRREAYEQTLFVVEGGKLQRAPQNQLSEAQERERRIIHDCYGGRTRSILCNEGSRLIQRCTGTSEVFYIDRDGNVSRGY